MILSAKRRIIGLSAVFLVAIILATFTHAMNVALREPQAILGWLLLGLILFLAAYRHRKKLPVLPFGTSKGWLQFHIYVGLLSLPVLLLHTGWRLPGGLIDAPLGVLFMLVFSSGVVGLILNRKIPPRLTSRGEEVIYERIPFFIRKLRLEAEECVIADAENSSDVLGELYLARLHSFFQRPANFLRHVLHSRSPRYAMLQHLEDARRFLGDSESSTIDRLIELVRRKDDLDYQFALQSLLKYWLFVHIPLTGALLVFSFFHIVVARSY